MKTPIETERKFLIRMPDINALAALNGVDLSDIEQTYLVNPDGLTERVRKRVYKNKTVYTHTTKKRVSKLSSEEYESVIDEDEYKRLLEHKDPLKRVITKTRCAVPYEGHVAEIDIYPFWQKQAVLEIELNGEDDDVAIPEFVSVIREVTGDHAYSNNKLSISIPDED